MPTQPAHVFFIKPKETSVCPICGGHFVVIGTRPRKVKEADGDVKTLIIRRLRCRECKKIHHELPDILIPYKRHSAETIEDAISGKGDESYCEEGTTRRIRTWWLAMLPYFLGVIDSLRAKYNLRFNEQLAPKEIVRAVVNANLWTHTRSAWRTGES